MGFFKALIFSNKLFFKFSTKASRKISIGEVINNIPVKFNTDGEILPLTFLRSRIPVRIDQKVGNFWNAPPKCGSVSVVYSF